MTRLVVFDVDGTLVDSQHLIVAAMAEAFGLAGHPLPPRDMVLGVVGLSLHEAMMALAPHLPEAETLLLAEHYRESFVAQRETGGAAAHAPLYPGALDALGAARGGAGHAARGRDRQGAARARPSLRVLSDRAPVRDDADRRQPPLEAASRDAARGARRDRRGGGAGGDGRGHRVRHGDGAGGRDGDGRASPGAITRGQGSRRPAPTSSSTTSPSSTPRWSGSGSRRDAAPPPLLAGGHGGAGGDGFGVRLDDRPLRTPAGDAAARADGRPSPRRSPRSGTRSTARSGPSSLPLHPRGQRRDRPGCPRSGAGGRGDRRLRRDRPALLPRRRTRGARGPPGGGLGSLAGLVGADAPCAARWR